ncbi:DUF2059 domain-containing protein [Polaribacter sp. MSW13]|uniref:DUF2059 domain-containing protein n=1 Tax=Polaribacter marinus TaxID=2916838 RepID=A0A9X2AIE4_9FLAO|nr:DUF2059 domain-containing protein [Polaribacter marinus]MCI2228476.1 DUF2059 domain-containing protein [Polaribacter marinus]
MKKIVIILVFLAFSVSNANAQDKTAYQKDAYTLVEIISKPAFKSVVDQFAGYVKKDNLEKFKSEVEGTFPDLYTSLTELYIEEYTHNEIKELLKFYKTDLGKKVAGNSTKLAIKGQAIGADWGAKLQGIMVKYQ